MNPSFIIQPSFTTGEISHDVSSRIDLEQYKSALLLAENAIISPYGMVCRRPGSQFIGACKYSDKNTALVEFNGHDHMSYLLEVGAHYIRVWKNGIYLGVEVSTPYESEIIPELRFTQSADVMFICSGKYSVMTLTCYGEKEWRFSAYRFSEFPFDETNSDEEHKVQVTKHSSDKARITSTINMFREEMIGTIVKVGHYIPMQHTTGVGSVVENHHSDWIGTSSNDAGNDIYHDWTETIVKNVDSTVQKYSTDEDTSWKFVTHGTWTGTVKLQTSKDGKAWKDYRVYTSKNDNNVTDTGTIDKSLQMKCVTEITSGQVNIDLSFMPYWSYGLVQLTRYIDEKTMEVEVISPINSTEASDEWALSSWNAINGFPKMCTFFQDRLVFASTTRKPNYIWMSRTGDYPNFGVEKVDGDVVDDSAITLAVINRKLFNIRHLVPANDLIILTDGNEWIVDGSQVITPKNVNPKIQTQHGCSSVEPSYIGNRCVYVQARGGTVRDMGYSYESDNYAGIDLSLFAKHLTSGHTMISSAYVQDPDSVLHFVRDDGTIICLTYIQEQKVYGWSHFVTDGKYLAVESVSEGIKDNLYVVVQRKIQGESVQYIEKFSPITEDSIFMDSYMKEVHKGEKVREVTVSHLAGRKVKILIDHQQVNDVIVPDDGVIRLEIAGNSIELGLSYMTKIKQPSFETQLRDGSLQGRMIKVSNAVLRLKASRGGKIGLVFDHMDDIDILSDELFTGDIQVTLPSLDMGYNSKAHVCIASDEPYPFNLLAIIRQITIGGGYEQNYHRGI